MASDPQVGQLRRRALLDSLATYRVVAVDGGHVTVEVIDVAGLEPGREVRLTAESVAEMELLDPASAPAQERSSPSLGPSAFPRTA
jgi:hypothetical protein